MPKRIADENSTKVHWGERAIGQLIKNATKDDHIVVFEASHLACSTSQILEILSMAANRKVQVHFVKYNLHITNQSEQVDTQHILQLISKIESDFISKRTSQALARRKAAGLPLGRPKGRGNKSLKLDKFRQDIKKYLDLGISKASIAKLVDCHPQTLYDWLERNDFSVEEETVA
jgi:DNA invertase Pin-like site-specific DNA recombinase